MSTSINDGGPAFPSERVNEYSTPKRGMSLRDWFAGQALAGLLADSNAKGTKSEYVKDAYGIADTMLAARNEEDSK